MTSQLELQRVCRKEFLHYREQRKDQELKLMLAAGPHYTEGWFCTDIMPDPDKGVHYCDMTKKFCFESETFDFVYSEHGIEHIEFEEALLCLSECYRVLKKGGVLRLATPSLEKWVQYYANDNEANDRITVMATHLWMKTAHECQIYSKALVFNNAMRNWDHRVLYDFDTLQTILLGLRFTDVVSARIGESPHSELRNLEQHGRVGIIQEYNEMEVLVIEARK